MKRLASMIRELKLYGMIGMIVATVWVCAWSGSMAENVQRIRYWPAIAPANQSVAAVDLLEDGAN